MNGTQTGFTRIVICEPLDPTWQEWLAPLAIERLNEGTLITGMLPDRAALYGTIRKIQHLGLTIRSLNPVGHDGKEYLT
jgi:hypothetical protein